MGKVLIREKKKSGLKPLETVALNSIKSIVCQGLNIPQSGLYYRSRKRIYVWPRAVTTVLIAKHTNLTLMNVANELRLRDHSIVLHYKKLVSNVCDTNYMVRDNFKLLEKDVLKALYKLVDRVLANRVTSPQIFRTTFSKALDDDEHFFECVALFKVLQHEFRLDAGTIGMCLLLTRDQVNQYQRYVESELDRVERKVAQLVPEVTSKFIGY